MESTLQLIVQNFIYMHLFSGKRSTNPSVFFSIATSSTMITIAATKALIPQRLQNNQKESLMTHFTKIRWVFHLNIIIFVTVFITLGKILGALCRLFVGMDISKTVFSGEDRSELEINISLAMHCLIMIYIICACLLVKFNCFITIAWKGASWTWKYEFEFRKEFTCIVLDSNKEANKSTRAK